ncbi:MAG: hypothetical protein ACRDTG_27680 [Pseudonocardiaceae bacterium]
MLRVAGQRVRNRLDTADPGCSRSAAGRRWRCARAARARAERTENSLVATPPVEILAEDVQRVAQQQPAGGERVLAQVLLG